MTHRFSWCASSDSSSTILIPFLSPDFRWARQPESVQRQTQAPGQWQRAAVRRRRDLPSAFDTKDRCRPPAQTEQETGPRAWSPVLTIVSAYSTSPPMIPPSKSEFRFSSLGPASSTSLPLFASLSRSWSLASVSFLCSPCNSL